MTTCSKCQELSEALEDSRREADTLREALRLAKVELTAMPVIFQGQAWKRADAVNPHTCEGCHAQKADGVPCGVNGNKTPPPCGDGILVRWREDGAA